MKVYISIYDRNQGADAARTTLRAAQQVIEKMTAEFEGDIPDVRWENLARVGYATTWAYMTGIVGSRGDTYGHVQELEVTD